ncbi:MAG: transcriptional repressor LexA [Bacteroidetes bacterium]|nr:transcriptional repressor LexA [Bacteroidota bacterium]
MRELTKRQAEILNFIRRFMGDNGFPPTLHELCREFGFGSTNAATQFLRTLERKGHIRRPLRGASRGITLIEQGELSAAKQTPMRNLVIISTKAATPLDAFMQPEGQIAVDAAYYGLNDKAFAVRVNDFAMKNIGIFKDDIVIATRDAAPTEGDIVAALVNGSVITREWRQGTKFPELRATVKSFPSFPANVANPILGVAIAITRILRPIADRP